MGKYASVSSGLTWGQQIWLPRRLGVGEVQPEIGRTEVQKNAKQKLCRQVCLLTKHWQAGQLINVCSFS